MLTSAKNETVKFRDDREIYQCTRKRQGCTGKRHASGRGQPSQLLSLHSLCSADTNNAPSNLCGGESGLRLLLVLVLAPRGFSSGTPVFPSPQLKTTISKFQYDLDSVPN